MKKKMVALCASALTFCSSMTVLTPAIANAEECKGVTERKEVAKDFDNTMRWYESKMNSCDTKKTLDAWTLPEERPLLAISSVERIPLLE